MAGAHHLSRLGPRRPLPIRVPAACLAALLGVLAAGKASSFETLGITWKSGVASYRVNPNFPDTALAGDVDRQIEVLRCAADAWSEQTRCDFRFDYRGTTTIQSTSDRDGTNVIFYSSEDGGEALAATLISGDFRRGTTSFDTVFYASTDGQENRWSAEADPPPGTLDIRGVAVHELGHALGLGHSDVFESTMFYAIKERGVPLRTLHPDDREGAEFLYGLGTLSEPAVEIATVTPAFGPSEGGNEVVLQGSNFTYGSDTRLSVGETAVLRADWRVESCGSLRILRMPARALGSVSIRVENSIGTATVADAYEYQEVLREFIRGDADDDGTVAVTDAVFLLGFLFRGEPRGPCDDAADANDDGSVDVSDPVRILLFLYGGAGIAPLVPYPEPGTDSTQDALGCGS